MLKQYKPIIITLTVVFIIILGTVEYVKYLMNEPIESISEHLQLKAPAEKILNSRKIKDQDNNDIVKDLQVSETEAPTFAEAMAGKPTSAEAMAGKSAKTIKTDKDVNITIPSEFKLKNKNISLLWTDDNTNENLIIQSDKKYYYGRDSSMVYFSITNTSLNEQEPKIRFLFDNEENRGVKRITQLNNKGSLALASGQSNFYSAEIYYPKNAQGEFFIEAKGSNGGYGYLDPYYVGSLVAYWSFNGPDMDWASTTAEALDTSGNSRNGNVIGAKAAIGQLWQALEFDGTDDYIDAGNVHSGVKTIAFWIKADGTDNTTYFDGKLDEIYFYSQQLNIDQIKRLYRAGARRTIIGNYSSSPSPLSLARPTSKILDLNGAADIEVLSGTITANNFTSPTIYVDGSATSTIDNGWRFVVVTTGTGIDASAATLGKVAASWTCGTDTVTDIDGNIYNTVLIDDQCWMAENMRAITYPDGSPITKGDAAHGDPDWGADHGWYSCPPNAGNNGEDCGAAASLGMLYQWSAAMASSTTPADDPPAPGDQGICPTGWHVPTDAEQHILDDYLDETTCNGDRDGSYDCNPAGSKLAGNDAADADWAAGALDDPPYFDSSGFNAPPSGYRITLGNYFNRTYYAILWSSSEAGANAWYRLLFFNNVGVYRNDTTKAIGFSVRCLKN